MLSEQPTFRTVTLPGSGEAGTPRATCTRRAQRFDLDVSGLLTFPSGMTTSIRLRNLSSGGLMAELSEWLEVGTEVLVTIDPLGQIRTEVVWQMGGRFGGSFLVPLKAAELFAAGMTGLEQGRA